MFRKLSLTAIASLALLIPLMGATPADAHEHGRDFHHGHRHEDCFRVYFRESCNRGWSFGATFPSRRAAERFAEGYRCRGFEVSIR